VLSLAYPFLAADVPAVVGTLWKVDDGDAAAFSREFYRRIHDGLEVTAAVAGAQRALLHSRHPKLRRPAAWAAFQVVGRGSFALAPPPRRRNVVRTEIN
jgi:CHAT domain-containing protein